MTLSLFLNFKAVSRVCFLTLRLAATCLKRHTNNCGRVYGVDDYSCVLCNTGCEETSFHLLFDCSFSQACWNSISII
jgi:hypothetical protein